jgi:hypothetical protein
MTSKTPDTPSTEAHEHNWQEGYGVAPYCRDCGAVRQEATDTSGPDMAGGIARCRHGAPLHACNEQEAADTSDHRLIFAAASFVNSEPMLYCSCGLWQWTTAVRDVDLSHFRGREAADTSGLREALTLMVEHHDAHPAIILGHACAEVEYARAALEGATERPLDVERLAATMHALHPGSILIDCERIDRRDATVLAAEYARLASPTTTEEA